MRVAILTRDYPPAIGGIATHVKGLVEALRRLGIEADVYVGSNDVKTLFLPFDIPAKEYDLIHVQSLPYGAFVYGAPMVVTVHSPVLEEFSHYRNSLKVVSIPAMAMERFTLSKAKALLAVSDQSKSDLATSYHVDDDRIRVIGNGVDYENFSKGEEAARSTSKRVLVVSRLEPRKNVEEAVAAVASLPPGACDLYIAGDGSERTSLKALAKDLGSGASVHFLGRVDEASLPELYSQSPIFLTASGSEGFGLSLLEAMASGCVCLASDIPTHRALIAHGVNGMIFATRDDLVASLRELLASPQMAARMGEEARRSAAGHTWERVAERVVQAYESVVER